MIPAGYGAVALPAGMAPRVEGLSLHLGFLIHALIKRPRATRDALLSATDAVTELAEFLRPFSTSDAAVARCYAEMLRNEAMRRPVGRGDGVR